MRAVIPLLDSVAPIKLILPSSISAFVKRVPFLISKMSSYLNHSQFVEVKSIEVVEIFEELTPCIKTSFARDGNLGKIVS